MTRPLIWSEAFAVGHDELDDEHRRLVAHINDLCTCAPSRDFTEIAGRLHVLAAEAERHLQHETLVLHEFRRDLEDPGQHLPREERTTIAAAIEDHVADHVTLRHRLAEATRRVQNGHWAERDSLCQLVETWFLDHAVKYDIQIKTIIQSLQRPSSRA